MQYKFSNSFLTTITFLIVSHFTFNVFSQELISINKQDSKQAEFEKVIQQQPLILQRYYEKIDTFMADNEDILIKLSRQIDRCRYKGKHCARFESNVDEFNKINQEDLIELKDIAGELEESLWQMQILLRDEKIRDDNRETLAAFNKQMLTYAENYEDSWQKNYGEGQKYLSEVILN